MRRGTCDRCLGAWVPGCLGEVPGCRVFGWLLMPGCEGAAGGAKSGFANPTGLADVAMGQSAVTLDDIDVTSVSGSGAWQCDVVVAVSWCDGDRQPASHQARSGAAAASTTAVRIRIARFKTRTVKTPSV